MSGFIFDLPVGKIGFNPINTGKKKFSCIWSVDSGWGTVAITENKTVIKVHEGSFKIKQIELPYIKGKKLLNVKIDNKKCKAELSDGVVCFDDTEVRQGVTVRY